MRPSPSRDSQDNQGGNSSSYKPINLSYRALESRGKEREKQTKTPLIIHHSLLGRKENWNPISEVWIIYKLKGPYVTFFIFQIINRTTQRKVVNVDARNHGESPHTNDMSLPLMAKDVAHLVKKMPNTDKISFMGNFNDALPEFSNSKMEDSLFINSFFCRSRDGRPSWHSSGIDAAPTYWQIGSGWFVCNCQRQQPKEMERIKTSLLFLGQNWRWAQKSSWLWAALCG